MCVSGLTSTTILVKQGQKVVVVEKQPQFGGAFRQFKRQGLSFYVGFHYTGCLGEGAFLDSSCRCVSGDLNKYIKLKQWFEICKGLFSEDPFNTTDLELNLFQDFQFIKQSRMWMGRWGDLQRIRKKWIGCSLIFIVLMFKDHVCFGDILLCSGSRPIVGYSLLGICTFSFALLFQINV